MSTIMRSVALFQNSSCHIQRSGPAPSCCFISCSLLTSVCTDVQTLSMSNNLMEGDLPDALWQTVWLRKLNLNNNKFVGTISNYVTAFTLQVCSPPLSFAAQSIHARATQLVMPPLVTCGKHDCCRGYLWATTTFKELFRLPSAI